MNCDYYEIVHIHIPGTLYIMYGCIKLIFSFSGINFFLEKRRGGRYYLFFIFFYYEKSRGQVIFFIYYFHHEKSRGQIIIFIILFILATEKQGGRLLFFLNIIKTKG